MAITNAPSRRERKRQDVRDRLYTAAAELFVAQGFADTTMDDIADRADVARATVFNYFPQKGEFLVEWGRRRRARVQAALAADNLAEQHAADQLHRYLQEMANLNVTARRESVMLMDAAVRFGGVLREPALDVELTEVIREGQTRGELRADTDATQAGTLLAAGYFAAVLRWINVEPEPFDLTAHLDDMVDLVLRGLLPEEE